MGGGTSSRALGIGMGPLSMVRGAEEEEGPLSMVRGTGEVPGMQSQSSLI